MYIKFVNFNVDKMSHKEKRNKCLCIEVKCPVKFLLCLSLNKSIYKYQCLVDWEIYSQ